MDRRQLAAKSVLGRFRQRGLGLDAQIRLQVLRLGGDAGAGAEVEGQPLDFLARDAALVRQAADEQFQGVRAEADLVAGQRLAHQARHVARLVVVAGDRRHRLGLFRSLAQRRIPAERAGLDQKEGFWIEFAGRVRLDRLGRGPVDGRTVPGQFQSDQPPAAAQGAGGKLVRQTRRIAVQVALGHQGDIERIVGVRAVAALARRSARSWTPPRSRPWIRRRGRPWAGCGQETFDIRAAWRGSRAHWTVISSGPGS